MSNMRESGDETTEFFVRCQQRVGNDPGVWQNAEFGPTTAEHARAYVEQIVDLLNDRYQNIRVIRRVETVMVGIVK